MMCYVAEGFYFEEKSRAGGNLETPDCALKDFNSFLWANYIAVHYIMQNYTWRKYSARQRAITKERWVLMLPSLAKSDLKKKKRIP